jgi:outer membrane protein assembly factor BamB
VRDPKTGGNKFANPPLGAPAYQIVALDPQTASTKWSLEVNGKVFSLAKGRDGTIYAGSYDGHIYALDPDTGALKWRFWTGGEWGKMPVHAIAVASDGTIYAGAGSFVEAIRPP